MTGVSVLLVEDNPQIRKGIKYSLQKESYLVDDFDNAEDALEALTKHHYQLLILDLMLPQMSGEELLEHLAPDNQLSIIVISAISDEFTQINLYNKKIDDYVVKPFSTNILLLKIEAILRRNTTNHNRKITYRSLVLEVDNYLVYEDDKLINLTSKEFDILQSMLLNPGKVFTRDELITVHWGVQRFY